MPKREFIMLRVDSETKKRFEVAASQQGQSLTTFILNAAEKAAKRTKPVSATTQQAPTEGRFMGGPLPKYFRACCLEAGQGGSFGYDHPAYHLTMDLPQPDDLIWDEWVVRLRDLKELVNERDDEAVLGWYDRHYPRCMKLIPARRRERFLEGVYQTFEAGKAGA